MAVLLTAPDRLALILKDAHADVREAAPDFVKDLTSIDRPGWIITDESAQYLGQGSSSGHSEDTDVYTLEFVGKRFGQGLKHEHERNMREIIAATVDYLRRHPQLQFSNTRGLAPATLKPLTKVLWINLTRGTATLHGSGDNAFWGCVMTLTVRSAEKVDVVII